MRKITSEAEILSAIRELEYQQAAEWPLLKEQFLNTYESFKPLNIIKNSIRELTTSPDLKENLLGATMGMTAGFLSKKILVGESQNPIKQFLGTLIELGISNIVSRHPETIKSAINSIIGFFSKEESKNENSNEPTV